MLKSVVITNNGRDDDEDLFGSDCGGASGSSGGAAAAPLSSDTTDPKADEGPDYDYAAKHDPAAHDMAVEAYDKSASEEHLEAVLAAGALKTFAAQGKTNEAAPVPTRHIPKKRDSVRSRSVGRNADVSTASTVSSRLPKGADRAPTTSLSSSSSSSSSLSRAPTSQAPSSAASRTQAVAVTWTLPRNPGSDDRWRSPSQPSGSNLNQAPVRIVSRNEGGTRTWHRRDRSASNANERTGGRDRSPDRRNAPPNRRDRERSPQRGRSAFRYRGNYDTRDDANRGNRDAHEDRPFRRSRSEAPRRQASPPRNLQASSSSSYRPTTSGQGSFATAANGFGFLSRIEREIAEMSTSRRLDLFDALSRWMAVEFSPRRYLFSLTSVQRTHLLQYLVQDSLDVLKMSSCCFLSTDPTSRTTMRYSYRRDRLF